MKTQIQTRIGTLALTLALLGGLAPRAEAVSSYKLPIAFTNYTRAEVLPNFPVLVTFSNGLYGFDYSKFTAPASGGDLRFEDSTESAFLDFEIEKWNTNGASYAWVRVPQLSSNTTIYAKWGGSDTTLPACTTNGAVWDATFAAVWHLKDGTTLGTVKDSTTNGYTATINGTVNAVTGRVDGAADFNGTAGNYLATTFNPSTRLGNNLTIRALVYPRATGNYKGVAGDHGGNYQGLIFLQYENSSWSCNAGLGAAGWGNGSTMSLDLNGWNDVSAVYTNSGGSEIITAYKDGVQQTPGTKTGNISHLTTFAIGRAYDAGNRYFNGIVDELRVSSVARSANWVWAEYANMASNAFFNGYGTVQAVGVTGSPQIQNQTPTGVGTNGATFNARLVTNGFENAAVYVAWGQTNGSVSGSWATTTWWNPGDWPNGSYPFTNMALSANANYYYTFGATNSTTNVMASGYQYLITGEVTVQATDPLGRTNASDTAAFTVFRPDTCTNEDLAVNYTLGGTASNVTDYAATPASGAVILLKGQTNGIITVTPVYKQDKARTVVLTLTPGVYAIGSQNAATCTLAKVTGTDRYWVAASAGNWNSTANWSDGSGDAGGSSVPGSGNVAIFDGGGAGNCLIDAAVNVLGLKLNNGYAGIVTQGAFAITVGSSGWTQAGGTFTGYTTDASKAITLNGATSFTLSGGVFNNTAGTLLLNCKDFNAGAFTHSGGTFNHCNGTVEFDMGGGAAFTISAPAITFYNLILNGARGSGGGTLGVGNVLTVNNTFTYTAWDEYGGIREMVIANIPFIVLSSCRQPKGGGSHEDIDSGTKRNRQWCG